MTDAEYFSVQLSLAYAEAGTWQAALRTARVPERIEYCQERMAAAQARIDSLCEKLHRIKAGDGHE